MPFRVVPTASPIIISNPFRHLILHATAFHQAYSTLFDKNL
ncbi:hypothetical protein CSC04_0369 [Enterobacter roggenkampii]|nr:hypothetical protein CSC04_0369 [Enterobacter roggenkampii]